VQKPPITISCDCGKVGSASYGERWRCEQCGRTWDTGQIPAEEYAALLLSIRRYRLLTLAPPLLATAVLLPLAVLVDLRFALVLFAAGFTWALFVVPQLRRRTVRRVVEGNPRWVLHPDRP
jgi:hypothetical protein